MAVDIVSNPYKADFPLLVKHPHIAFLDSAATAQRPKSVIDAQVEFYETMNANPLRGLYELSVKATAGIRKSREHIAAFIGADNADDIIFTRNTSESLNLLAYAFAPTVLSEGDEVCITIMEHHSNMIPWQQVCRQCGAKLVYMYCDKNGIISEEEMAAKIGPKTKIVSATHISNVLGIENPIARMAELAHAQGAYMIVDAAQSTPHINVDVAALDCDFLAFSAHKVFGPMGIGILWGKHELLKDMPPFLTGGEMIDIVHEQDAVWSPVPEKFEAGTQDAAGIYATEAALTYMEQVGVEEVEAREAALMEYLMSEFAKLDYIEIIGSEDPALHHGACSFNIRDIHPHDVSSIMAQDNVAIRAGHHCAQPLLNFMGIRSCCRASVAFYNDASDIDQLIESVKGVWRIFHGE